MGFQSKLSLQHLCVLLNSGVSLVTELEMYMGGRSLDAKNIPLNLDLESRKCYVIINFFTFQRGNVCFPELWH